MPITKVFMANFAWELCKNDPTIKNYSGMKGPADLAKKWNKKLDPIIHEAIGEFLVSDKFFQVVGDKPMPKLTPSNFKDVVGMLKNAAKNRPATEDEVLKRLEDNVLVKWALRKGVNKDIVALISTK